jgi:hypothetical protein
MQTKIGGIKYRYTINHDRSRHLFWIAAIHKKSKRTSNIMNLNPILGEYNVSERDSRYEQSVWSTRGDAPRLIGQAKSLLSDAYFQKYLKKILDEDRYQSEWENFISFSN